MHPRGLDLRGTALVACIAAALSALAPIRSALQQINAAESAHPLLKWSAAMAVVFIFTAVPLVFLFALYSNQGTLRVPRHFQWLSLGAACTLGVMTAPRLWAWSKSWGLYWAAMKTLNSVGGAVLRDPRTTGQLSFLLGEFSNVAFILLLIALFQHPAEDPRSHAPISKLLRFATKVAVIFLGLLVAGYIIQLLVTPYTYALLRRSALLTFRSPSAI